MGEPNMIRRGWARFCSKACKYAWWRDKPSTAHATVIRRLTDDEPLPTTQPRRYATGDGYVVLRWKIGRGEYVEALEHRVVTGRVSPEVHHINRDRSDNRPENLLPVNAVEHKEHHRTFDWLEAARLYEAGTPITELAKRYRKDNGSICRTLNKLGVQMRTPGESILLRNPVDSGRIRHLFTVGLGARGIAQAMGISKMVVSHRLRQMGLSRRPGNYTKAEVAALKAAGLR